MKFYVRKYKEEDNRKYSKNSIILDTDYWNDYTTYETLFHAYFYNGRNLLSLGEIKIIDINQYNDEIMNTRSTIPSEFTTLPSNYYSLGQDVAFYRRLKKYCEKRNKSTLYVLRSLRDISIVKKYKDDVIQNYSDAFHTSLTRFSEANKAFKEAASIVDPELKLDKNYDIEFNYHVEGAEKEHQLSLTFDTVSKYIPNRINAIIGKNATGKTLLLSALAEKYSGAKIDDETTSDRPSFSKYISISFNSYDDFYQPSSRNREIHRLRQHLNSISQLKSSNKRIRSFESKFGFDFDDITSKCNKYFNKSFRKNTTSTFSYVYCGLRQHGELITDAELIRNFVDSFNELASQNRHKKWRKVLNSLFGSNSLEISNIIDCMVMANVEEEITKLWRLLSSGQHALLSIITNVVANISDESLLILDEPETHLHPNAVGQFLKALYLLLEEYDSFAIISTHSPQIIQQIPSQYVKVFLRDEVSPNIVPLETECFGMEISSIIKTVFEVQDHESNYKSVISSLIDSGLSRDDILELFENGLSFNAKMYLNSKYRSLENEAT